MPRTPASAKRSCLRRAGHDPRARYRAGKERDGAVHAVGSSGREGARPPRRDRFATIPRRARELPRTNYRTTEKRGPSRCSFYVEAADDHAGPNSSLPPGPARPSQDRDRPAMPRGIRKRGISPELSRAEPSRGPSRRAGVLDRVSQGLARQTRAQRGCRGSRRSQGFPQFIERTGTRNDKGLVQIIATDLKPVLGLFGLRSSQFRTAR